MSAVTVDGAAPPGMTADDGILAPRPLAPRPRRKRRWRFWVTAKYLLWTHHLQIDWTGPGMGTGFPSDAIVAREAIPAGTNGPDVQCPGPGTG